MKAIAATQLLRDQHKTLKGLFRQFEVVDRRAREMKAGVVREILMLLEVHFELEEQFIFPRLIEAADESGRELTAQARTDHAEVRALARVIEKRSVFDEYFNAGFLNLITTAEEHLGFEEERILALADEVLGSVLDELGPRLQERYEYLITKPQYGESVPWVVQNPHGGEQKRRVFVAGVEVTAS